MASPSEARIREKAVTQLRAEFPGARIIHELKLEYGNSRLDIVAVTRTEIVVVEVKSEKDTLERLGAQMMAAHAFGTQSWLVMNEVMFDVLNACRWIEPDGSVRVARNDWVQKELDLCGKLLKRAVHIKSDAGTAIHSSRHFKEFADAPLLSEKGTIRDKRGKWTYYGGPGDLLKALWVAEMKEICQMHGIKCKLASIPDMRPAILRALTGDQINRAVCRALRRRPFACADAPILGE